MLANELILRKGLLELLLHRQTVRSRDDNLNLRVASEVGAGGRGGGGESCWAELLTLDSDAVSKQVVSELSCTVGHPVDVGQIFGDVRKPPTLELHHYWPVTFENQCQRCLGGSVKQPTLAQVTMSCGL